MWCLEDNKLILRFPELDVFWAVPDDFEMPHGSLLRLAEWLLLRLYGVEVEQETGRNLGNNIGIAFSGGYDSIAAMELLPPSIPIFTHYIKRSSTQASKAIQATQHFDLHAIVSSNVQHLGDVFPHKKSHPYGQWGFGVYGVSAVLFADYFDLGTVAVGHIIDYVYLGDGDGLQPSLGHGTFYNESNVRVWAEIIERYAAAGLHFTLPLAGLTEVSTNEIHKTSPVAEHAHSCWGGDEGQPCDRCFKCFRKSMLTGRSYAGPPTHNMMKQEFIPGAPGTLLWLQRQHKLDHPTLATMKQDVSWVDKWYPDSLRFIPKHLQACVVGRIKSYGIEEVENVNAVRSWNSRRMAP